MKKADHLHRGLAKGIDFILAGAISPFGIFGILGGAMYLAIADGFSGQSLGKRLIGLKVITHGHPASYRESILRNLMYSLILMLVHIPLLGPLIFGTLGLIVVVAESYFVIFDEAGIRIGDILADTQVADEHATAAS